MPTLQSQRNGWHEPSITVTCVYRLENEHLVQRMLADVADRADIRLWALDAIGEGLALWTLGSGPGSRFELHQTLLKARPLDPACTWLIADDDVDMGAASMGTLATVAHRAGFDVFGPVHGPRSNFSHLITMQRPLLIARECSFVEVGPIIGFSPLARSKLLPFYDSSGLGWGMEAVWAAARADGLRTGLVDAQAIRHLGTVGKSYGTALEEGRSTTLLQEHGFTGRSDLFRIHNRWWFWQESPPWAA